MGEALEIFRADDEAVLVDALFALLMERLDTASMAARLGVSRTAVRAHVDGMLTKLGVDSRLEAASVATRSGLIESVTGVQQEAAGSHR